MKEGIGRIKGIWEAIAVQYKEMAAAFDIPATTLAQMIVGSHIRSYHIFRRDRIEKAYRLLREQLKRGEKYIRGQNT